MSSCTGNGGSQSARSLSGRVAVVTGASAGIGAGLARMLAGEGARVVLAARQQKGLEDVADSIREGGGHAVPIVTEVIQDGNHTNGIKAWVVCPGFVDTEMRYVVPGANPANFLRVEEVVDVVRFLLHTADNVKLGPEILVRTMCNPMSA
jgi:short-subunit dehydrogenase